MLRTQWRSLALVVTVLVLVAVMGQALYVHSETGRWAVSVSAAKAPSRVHFEGRDYDKGDRAALPSGAIEKGRTAGGGVIFKRAEDADVLSTGVYVSDGKRSWTYGLVGGP